MQHTSVRLNTPCELINITPLNPLISKCQIKVCYVGDAPNRNHSIITKEVAREMANSLPGSPIVGYFNEETKDFEEHNRELIIKDGKLVVKETTRPYGFVDLHANVWFQKFLDDGLYEREYLVTEGWLWTGQYPECKRVITKGNNQSMELDDKFSTGNWTRDEKGDPEFFIINEAIISKLCILGENNEPCFEGSHITAPKMEFSFSEDFKEQLFSMMKEIKEILKEGGTSVDNEEVKVIEENLEEETPVVEEEVFAAEEEVATPEEEVAPEAVEFAAEEETHEDVCPKCHKPLSECECEEDKKDEYVLDEIPEYIELRNNYSNLENQYNELKTQNENLINQVDELTTFKKQIEKAEKEAMIDKFYMLSDEDKADVVTNIDTYSLEEIEAKLSVICVRNRVSFDAEDANNNQEEPTTYNLNSRNIVEDPIPDWIKSLQHVNKKMK